MNKKRLFISVLSLALTVLVCFSVCSVIAATYIVDGDWKYEIMQGASDELSVAGYLGSNSAMEIPSVAFGKTVSRISENAFLNNNQISSCNVSATVKSIGNSAFYGCTSLAKINFYGGVESIGSNAFYGCTALTDVVFNPQVSLSVIPRYCFSHCDSLTTIVLPDSVTSVSDYAFGSCKSLKDITIPATVTEISPKAFFKSDNVTIHGYSGSAAERFALENEIPFVLIDDITVPTDPVVVPTTTADFTTTAPTASTTVPSGTHATEPTSSFTDASEPISSTGYTDSTEPTASTGYTDASEPIPSTGYTDTSEPGTTVGGKVYLIGDADLSGTINIKDATVIQKYCAGLTNLDKIAKFVANCDGLGDVNVKDATMVQKYCAGFLNVLLVGAEVVI